MGPSLTFISFQNAEYRAAETPVICPELGSCRYTCAPLCCSAGSGPLHR